MLRLPSIKSQDTLSQLSKSTSYRNILYSLICFQVEFVWLIHDIGWRIFSLILFVFHNKFIFSRKGALSTNISMFLPHKLLVAELFVHLIQVINELFPHVCSIYILFIIFLDFLKGKL